MTNITACKEGVGLCKTYKIWNLCNFAQASYSLHFLALQLCVFAIPIQQNQVFLRQNQYYIDFFVFDSLCHGQQFFSYVGMGLPGLNQY